MKTPIVLIFAVVLSLLNLSLLFVQFTNQALAEVAGMDSYDLEFDYDFYSAVVSIVEDCEVSGEEIDC